MVSILALTSSLTWFVTCCLAQQAREHFTVADEIGLTSFGGPFGHQESAEVLFSPDGNYFAVDTSRGRLDLNRPEDSLRFYRSQDIEDFLKGSDASQPPVPLWVLALSTDKEGPIIHDWCWLSDSSGVAFLERMAGGNQSLVLADLRKKTVEPLTSEKELVRAFVIRDRRHYVYSVDDPIEAQKRQAEHGVPAIVGTGRDIYELIFPESPVTVRLSSRYRALRAVVGGKRLEVAHNGWFRYWNPQPLAMSPDGRYLVTTLPVPEVPVAWETLFPPPSAAPSSFPRVRARYQDAQSDDRTIYQYVLIGLETGSIHALTDAPTGEAAGWSALGSPSWSNDGQAILLPGTFLHSKDRAPSRPCVAVLDIPSDTSICVEELKAKTGSGFEEGYHLVRDARFVDGDKHRVRVKFWNPDYSTGSIEYRTAADGTWQVSEQIEAAPEAGQNGLEVVVKQGLSEPPVLIATNKNVSRVIWDPNPQLKDVELGRASVYTWKDKEGREWRGGLYKPSNYKAGQRYPLVIQTHGFSESYFAPSGIYPTAFAARALAAAGIVVLQVQDVTVCLRATIDEGSCAVYGYEAAANRLVSEGLIDPERIGIIGFSRTCFYVMEMLTRSSLHMRAASITDGTMGNYFQYLVWAGFEGSPQEFGAMIGAEPFGEGLQQWLKRSPGFNLDKVKAPLLVVGEGPLSLLLMWEPYAGLHHLQKPVDLVMFNTDEHVLTNPAVRMASQGGSVDWFRFWLQDYEDPNPAKAEQYKRWHDLRRREEVNEQN